MNPSRQFVRFRMLTIPNKFFMTFRISVDDRVEFHGSIGENVTLTLYPYIEIQVSRPREYDQGSTTTRVWNPNDRIELTRFTQPLFIHEIDAALESMKLQEMYVYTGDRLDLNFKLAEEKKRVCQIGGVYVSIIPTVIEIDGKRLEGLRFIFNKEDSAFSLTLTEIEAFRYNLDKINIDAMALQLYEIFRKTGKTNLTPQTIPPM